MNWNEHPRIKSTTVLHFVYGSLKEGFHLHRSYEPVRIIAKDVPLFGYRMYKIHNDFPCIIFTGNSEDVVKGELMAYSDFVSRELSSMECGSGYYIQTEIINKLACLVYVWDPSYSRYITKENHIPSGVWERS
jgi:gamma-glutamylcyclotransferase (GGCT)/AIG2-like uncharacterized protein YtfP